MRRFLIALGLASTAIAQQAQSPAAPAPAANPYQEALAILKHDTPASAPIKAVRKLAPKKAAAPDIQGTISRGIVPLYHEVALPENARFALALSQDWLNTGAAPVASPDGRVLYVYGQGVPIIVCAMVQVCEMDMEPGESPIKDATDIGDTRFEVEQRSAGSGPRQFAYLVLKPVMPGLDTTLTVGTTKRAYYVRLISTASNHMTRVAFTYPEEAAERRQREEEAKRVFDEHAKVTAANLAKLNTRKPIRNVNYEVRLHGKDAHYLKPLKMGDDGIRTYITLSEQARHRGLPVVELEDSRGPIPANSHWEEDQLVVDALFERACLLEGVGRKQQRACITNKGLRAGESK